MLKSLATTTWKFFDDRTGASQIVVPMMKHIVPSNARWWYVFGSATLCCFIMQVVTGIGLALAYVPSGGEAFQSLKYITEQAPFGSILRGMHFFGASAMVLLAVMHMAQVYLHAAYKYPREMNWMSGVVLLLFTLGMGFTGQLLRWDANGIWSTVVGAEQAARVPLIGPFLAHAILAGDTIGGATLTRFFVLHVFIFPAFIFAGVGLHVLLIMRHGISEMPKKDEPVAPQTYKEEYEKRLKKTGVPFWPNAMWRDAVFSLIVVIGIIACAVFFGPPVLDKPPDPTTLDVNPAPDWYFLFYFAILSMLPASLETWVILGGPLIVILGLLILPLISNKGDRAPSRRPWAIAILATSITAIIVLTIYGAKAPWSPNFSAQPIAQPTSLSANPGADQGAHVFFNKGCIYCHKIEGNGGQRGPNLSRVGDRLNEDQLIIRINNGGHNMPAFAGRITHDELATMVVFLKSRRASYPTSRPTDGSDLVLTPSAAADHR
ncbi:MAG TPA: cytochrome b N-terminal domain-containing protein [Tepidisphaeraceae bacterium]|jgi:ubiquinol-cytochrome c reductase cytochrome b subunit|nr:cytochrome b N-terminal domain-containing protein [Tepidisphaeraceae bacterium]